MGDVREDTGNCPPPIPDKLPLQTDNSQATPVVHDEQMPSRDGPGTIRSDKMRSKLSYSEAASSLLSKTTSPPTAATSDGAVPSVKDRRGGKGAAQDGNLDVEMNDPEPDSQETKTNTLLRQAQQATKSSLEPTKEERDLEAAHEDESARRDLGASTHLAGHSKSQDNHEKHSYSKRKDRDQQHAEETHQLRRQIQYLSEKINTLNIEKQIAEEKADRALNRMEEIKKCINSDMSVLERDTAYIAEESKQVKGENQVLREQLSDAQSHIFSLQPYRKELTPEEVGRDYDTLVEQIQDWVQKFMEPWLDDYDEGSNALLRAARKRPEDVMRFRSFMHQFPDLVHGSKVPEVDEDVISSIIMRYIHDRIFQSILYREIPHYTDAISFIENHMQMSVEPKRDLFAVRTWTAEAYNAILSSSSFRSIRERQRKELTTELASILKIFCKKDQYSWFCTNLDNNCIYPAMQLYEKLQVSTHHFYLDINSFIVWGPGNELSTSPEFIDSLNKLDCRNVLQNRKAFNMAKLDPQPSKKELYHRLTNICTAYPALCMRQIGQKDAIKEPAIVRKQQMLVAWGNEDKRQKFMENGEQPLVSQLYHWRNEKASEPWSVFLRG